MSEDVSIKPSEVGSQDQKREPVAPAETEELSPEQLAQLKRYQAEATDLRTKGDIAGLDDLNAEIVNDPVVGEIIQDVMRANAREATKKSDRQARTFTVEEQTTHLHVDTEIAARQTKSLPELIAVLEASPSVQAKIMAEELQNVFDTWNPAVFPDKRSQALKRIADYMNRTYVSKSGETNQNSPMYSSIYRKADAFLSAIQDERFPEMKETRDSRDHVLPSADTPRRERKQDTRVEDEEPADVFADQTAPARERFVGRETSVKEALKRPGPYTITVPLESPAFGVQQVVLTREAQAGSNNETTISFTVPDAEKSKFMNNLVDAYRRETGRPRQSAESFPEGFLTVGATKFAVEGNSVRFTMAGGSSVDYGSLQSEILAITGINIGTAAEASRFSYAT